MRGPSTKNENFAPFVSNYVSHLGWGTGDTCTETNGVHQSGIFSAALLKLYIYDLSKKRKLDLTIYLQYDIYV